MQKQFLVLLFSIQLFFLHGQEYRYTNYNTETSDLPQNQITKLFQDSKGNIWVGTKFGVAKFDGESFRVYGQEDGIIVGDIQYIFETRKGEIIVCSNRGGISIINRDKIDSYPPPENRYELIYEQVHDSLIIIAWIKGKASKSELFSFKDGKYKLLKEYNANLSRPIFVNDSIWITFNDKNINNGFCYIDKKLNLSDIKIKTSFIGYYALGDSLFLYDNSYVYKYFAGKVSKIISIYGTNIFKVTSQGIYINENWDRNRLKEYSFSGILQNSFILSNVSDVLIDKEKNLWFGTENGLFKLSEKAFQHYIFKDYGIAPDNPGLVISMDNIWLSMYNGNLYKLENNKFIDFTSRIPYKNFPFLIAHTVKPDGTILWGGDYSGVLKYTGSCFRYINFKLESPLYAIYYDTLAQHTLYGLWGLIIEDKKGNIIFSKDKIKDHSVVVDIEKDTSGNYFLALRRSIFKFRDGKFEEYKYQALVIEHDSRHNLWFGGEGGLYFYNNKDFIKVEHSALKNKAITALHAVGDSVLLIGTTSGMAAMDLKAFYQKKKTVIKFYNANNGFSGNECSQNGFAEDSKGFVWIPVNDRLIRIDPRYLNFSNVPVEPYIAGISNLKDATWQLRDTSIHVLVHDENSIKFEFSGPYFSNPVSYSYFLEGYEKKWAEYSYQKEAVYANLPPGKYTFYVKAINGDESDNILLTSYSFVIKPAIWQTVWFYIVLVTLLAGITYLIIKRAVKQRTEKQQKSYEQNKLMMQAQLAQLDPHFIFNTLTTTGTFALRLKQIGIYDIIVQFSQLLRTHWANKKLTRTLAEELDFINEYCLLNRINHAERFDYTIEIGPNVDSSIKVIKLLIQNFVENAMKHGIENIKDHGEIKIKVSQDKLFTQIIIDDNGIGYNATIQKDTGRKRTGLKVISETIELYNSWNKYKMSFNIQDKSEINSNERGTLVNIKLPNDYNYRD